MEVVLDKQYPVASSVEAAWQVLSNMNELATCMPGAQITEEIDATHYKGAVKVKVGPAVAAFAGTIEILTLDIEARTLKMMGKGADKGGSSASMELTASLVPTDGGNCTLQGHAEVIVNGKFAQFGGRMMTSVSDMILAQFAEVFSQKAQVIQAGMVPVADTDISSSGTTSPAAVAPAPVAPVVAKEFNALGFVWLMIKNFIGGLFGRKS
ncbi:MAG: carbon monoxide dehydrogenase [Betaproteobacteria bacterium]|nr:carbon monoxide dehydrogenase [Betaproteobacteria bacterium]